MWWSMFACHTYVVALDGIWWHDDSNMLGFMLCHARWMQGWCDMYAMIRCMLGFVMWWYAMIRWMLGCLICMIDVWLGMIDAMLCVRCVLMCVCVCVNIDAVLSVHLIGLRHNTQWREANLRVRWFWVPNTFLRPYLNSEPISLVVRSKGPSSRRHYVYGS